MRADSARPEVEPEVEETRKRRYSPLDGGHVVEFARRQLIGRKLGLASVVVAHALEALEQHLQHKVSS